MLSADFVDLRCIHREVITPQTANSFCSRSCAITFDDAGKLMPTLALALLLLLNTRFGKKKR